MKTKEYFESFPPEWSIFELQEVSNRPIVYGIVQAGPEVADGVPYIKSSDVGEEIDVTKLSKTSKEIAKKYVRSEVRPGDIVFSLRGNIGELSVVPSTLPLANLTQGTARIAVNSSICSVVFIKQLLQSEALLKKVKEVAKGSTFQEISLEELRRLKVAIPVHEEQKAIASVLGLMDFVLNKTNQLIAKKKLQKKALVQQLLTGKKRLKGFSDSWNEIRLGEVFKEITATNDGGDTHSIMTISSRLGLISQEDKFDRVIAGDSLKKYTQLKREDFAYNKGNSKTYQMGCIFQLEDKDSALVPFVYICFSPSKMVHSIFYKQWFSAHGLDRQLRRIITSGARGDGLLNVDSEDFFKMYVPFPSKKEQVALAQVLQTADREIHLLKTKADKLKELKKGIMQILLTGKKRLKVAV